MTEMTTAPDQLRTVPLSAITVREGFNPTNASEAAGRCLALVVMAVLADEECVARSNRSMVSLHEYRPASYTVPGAAETGLPWRPQVVEMVEDLAIEHVPEYLTVRVREERERTRAEQERLAEMERAAEQADLNLRERLAELTPEERLDALREFGAEYARQNERTHYLREHILTLNASQPDGVDETVVSSASKDDSGRLGEPALEA